MAVFLKDGENFVRMSEEPYELEDVLQKLIADHPEILADDESGATKWLLVKREMGVPDRAEGADRWSLDHLLVDREGVLALVEVKRSMDTRARREVVAQMLDYAANGSAHWTVETVRDWFDAEHAEVGAEAALLALGRDDPEEFWADVKTNLAAGRMRLVFVADAIAPELRSIVEFLNGQMRETEVLAIEVRQFVDPEGGRQTFVPRLIGQTEAARAAKRGGPRQTVRWDEATLLEKTAEMAGEDAAKVARQLIAWATSHPRIRVDYGRGVTEGSAHFRYLDGEGGVLLTAVTHLDGRSRLLLLRLHGTAVQQQLREARGTPKETLCGLSGGGSRKLRRTGVGRPPTACHCRTPRLLHRYRGVDRYRDAELRRMSTPFQLPQGWKVVGGEGPLNGKEFCGLMIVGEAPGEEEEQAGRPFVGSSGRTLDAALEELGIDRDTAYVTNACKHRPRDGNGKTMQPSDEEVAYWRDRLRAEIAEMQPLRILALGKRCTWLAVHQAITTPDYVFEAWHPRYGRMRTHLRDWKGQIRRAAP